MLNIKLDRMISIDRPTTLKDATFQSASASWALLATVWAEVKDQQPSRSNAVRAGLELGRNQTRVRMRWREDVDATMRIRFGARTLKIVGGPAELGRREFMELMCEEYSSTGGA